MPYINISVLYIVHIKSLKTWYVYIYIHTFVEYLLCACHTLGSKKHFKVSKLSCKSRRRCCEEVSSRTTWFTSFKSYQMRFFLLTQDSHPGLNSKWVVIEIPPCVWTAFTLKLSWTKSNKDSLTIHRIPCLDRPQESPSLMITSLTQTNAHSLCLLENGQSLRVHRLRRQSFVLLFNASLQIQHSIVPPDYTIWDCWS